MDRNDRVFVGWLLVALLAPCAMAQTPEADARRREEWREQEERQRRAQEEWQRQQKATEDARKRQQESNSSTGGGYTPSPSGGNSAQMREDREQQLRAFLKKPPLPAERNILLGSWRLEAGGQRSAGAGPEAVTRQALGDLIGALSSNPQKMLCPLQFGSGITFTPSTFSMSSPLVGKGKVEVPIEYRSGGKQAIVAIVVGSRMYAQSMYFEIASPDRIVESLASCAMVRVGPNAANAAGNATTAPGNARMAAASPPPPQSTPTRPSPEVCRNTLLDKLGTVGTNQVRAMSDARFKEVAIEGKVPNTNHRRLDLRGSACDDPRIKATLYDFDGNEMLRSVTYVWDRPPGPAPAPIFQERVAWLSRLHVLPPPQTPGRLQADTALGRLILQDMPERNLLLEAYAAPK